MNYTIADQYPFEPMDGKPAPINPDFWRSREWLRLVREAKETYQYCERCKNSASSPRGLFVLLRKSGFEKLRSGEIPGITDTLCLCDKCNQARRLQAKGREA